VTPLMVFTIGHSTRPIDVFIRLLKAHAVQRVVDVRTVPRSRHNPQFNRDRLSPALHDANIHYRHMPGLAACAMRGLTLPTQGGATPASEAMPITCRPWSSKTAWRVVLTSRNTNASC
jgi:hypothetical protein